MDVVISSYISQSVYKTPRAFLLEHLNKETNERNARWVVKNESFEYDHFALCEAWVSQVRPTLSKEFHENNEYGDINYNYFWQYIWSSCLELRRFPGKRESCKLIKTSREKRNIVNDLDAGSCFHEWMIRFLSENSRTDWIDFIDMEKKEFRIFDIAEMGKMYTRVNDIRKVCPSYYIKLMLSSYCMNGILIQIDKKTNCYRFNEEWYQKELLREKEVLVTEEDLDDRPYVIESWVKYPDNTLRPGVYYIEWDDE